MLLQWHLINGREHVRKDEDEPWTALCGMQPILTVDPPTATYDTVTQVPEAPCRSCLMVVALGEDVVDPEPLEIARQRGYEVIDDDDLLARGVTSSEPPVL